MQSKTQNITMFNNALKMFIDNKMSFTVINKSSRKIILFPKEEIEFVKFGKMAQGIWLCKQVQDCLNKIEQIDQLQRQTEILSVKLRNYTFTHNQYPFRTFFNAQFIERVKTIPEKHNFIDINHCYWRTAYLLGYITEKVYQMGLQDKISKEARLQAIGHLNANKTEEIYIDGQLKISNDIANIKFKMAYYNILAYIENLYIDTLYNSQPDSYENNYFFMTDAFYVNSDYTNNIKYILTNNGYNFKEQQVISHLEGRKLIVKGVKEKQYYPNNLLIN